MKSPTRHSPAAIISALVAVLLIALAGVAWLNRQYIRDLLVVQQYVPATSVEQIASRSTMTQKGTFLFYASVPEVDDASSFNSHCQRREESSAILGCYANQRIYIYNVTDAQLDGVQEVTASHEMLHAAWDRLSRSEKTRLTPLLEKAYETVQTDELESRMAYYARTQPGERANELHSILGTEFSNLGDELESYYAQYFTNRATVVEFHTAYRTVFETIKKQSTTLAAELDSLAMQTNARIEAYNGNIEALNGAIEDLNARASSVDRTSSSAVNAFNTQRSQLLARADELSNEKRAIDSDIASYNVKLEEYNQLALQSEKLTKSIDSTFSRSLSL